MYFGTFTHNVDAKGRVFVPAKLRPGLGQRFYICKAIDKCPCIRIYSVDEFTAVVNKLKYINDADNDVRRIMAGSVCDIELDSQNRMMINDSLRAYANITDKASFVGVIDWVEIWNPDDYEEYMSNGASTQDVKTLREMGIR